MVGSIVEQGEVEAAREGTSAIVDNFQAQVAEDLKQVAVTTIGDLRDRAKLALLQIRQPLGKGPLARLKQVRMEWQSSEVADMYLQSLERLLSDYSQQGSTSSEATVDRDDLRLVCFEHVCP